MNPVQYKTEHV